MSQHEAPQESLDCIGLLCPEPLFQTREAMDALEVGDVLEVLTDDPAAEEDLVGSPNGPATRCSWWRIWEIQAVPHPQRTARRRP